jgi:hypothetical protein
VAEVVPHESERSSTERLRANSGSGNGRVDRAELTALYLRVADTLERSAELAELHAIRHQHNGRGWAVAVELERANRAREAARRGRALASRLTTGR